MAKRPMEDYVAGQAFIDSVVERADSTAMNGAAPLWHGWALMEAFLAGLDHEREAKAKPSAVKRKAKARKRKAA